MVNFDIHKKIEELSDKMDKILELQELIIDKLNPNQLAYKKNAESGENSTKKLTRKEERNIRIEEFKKEIEIKFQYGGVLQRQFNLVQEPSVQRIKNYLRTNDSSAFDGLKRK